MDPQNLEDKLITNLQKHIFQQMDQSDSVSRAFKEVQKRYDDLFENYTKAEKFLATFSKPDNGWKLEELELAFSKEPFPKDLVGLQVFEKELEKSEMVLKEDDLRKNELIELKKEKYEI